MSFNWRRRQNSIGDHQHTADQILNADTGERDGGGGGGVSVDILGPFRLTHGQFTGTGGNFPVSVTDALAVNDTILAVWIEIVTAFSGGGLSDATMAIGIAPTADLTDGSDLTAATNVRSVIGNTATFRIPTETFVKGVRIIGAASLIAIMATMDATPTAGAVDIYALVATPAS